MIGCGRGGLTGCGKGGLIRCNKGGLIRCNKGGLTRCNCRQTRRNNCRLVAQRSDGHVELLESASQRLQFCFDNCVTEQQDPYKHGRRSCDRRPGRSSPPIDPDPFLQNTGSPRDSFLGPLAIRGNRGDNNDWMTLQWIEMDAGLSFHRVEMDVYSTRIITVLRWIRMTERKRCEQAVRRPTHDPPS